jgi:glycosyltransferase involved in cell wall biosynthesis
VDLLFVHREFPAQFGHIAAELARRDEFNCTFVTEQSAGSLDGVRKLVYAVKDGARKSNHYFSRGFENFIWRSHAVYQLMRNHPETQPDLIVGHSGFGSTCFLRDLYDCPIINDFEFYYHGHNSDMDFRPEFPPLEVDQLRARARNAMISLDLEACTCGYSPTAWQRSQFPAAYQAKIDVIFDGIDTRTWCPAAANSTQPRTIQGQVIPDDMRIVTYVSRGFESMRGFDIFMKAAQILCQRRRDVLFVCVGKDKDYYGDDSRFTDGKSFLQYILSQGNYDLDRFLFTGRVPPEELANIFRLSDLHIYLTVPFVLSWSLINALACGCKVLASATPPVEEMITAGENGLLCDFFAAERFADLAEKVLDAPADYAPMGRAAAQFVRDRLSLDVVLPKMKKLFVETANRGA